MAGRVVVIGSFNVDHIWRCERLPVAGETRLGQWSSGPGGKGFNQAVACARSHAATAFITALGADAGAVLARELAARFAIELLAQDSDAPTGSAAVLVDAAGRNQIVVAPGANATLASAQIAAWVTHTATADVLLAQLEVPGAAVFAAFRQVAGGGALRVLNPAPVGVPLSLADLGLTDLLTPNESEFADLCTRLLAINIDADTVAQASDADLHGLCRRLTAGSVIITLGAGGCFVSHPDGGRFVDDATHYRRTAPKVEVVDTTGAGDAFNGALAARLAHDRAAPLAKHVDFALHYASMSTERVGAASAMPDAREVMQRWPYLR